MPGQDPAANGPQAPAAGAADLVIVGGGPAGYGAALRAAHRGLRAVLVERDALGGVCLNRGCIPTKAMLGVADLVTRIRDAEQLGLRVGEVEVDLPAVTARRDQTVARLRQGVDGLLRAGGVEVLAGTARLTPDGVAVTRNGTNGGEVAVPARHVLVATGSTAARPPLPGADLPGVIDSDGALTLTAVPERLVIAGGGAVGAEWACVFAAFGAAVTLLELAPTLLPLEDPVLGGALEQALQRQGVEVRTGTGVEAIRPRGDGLDGLEVHAGADRFPADHVLLALGRAPVTGGLGLADRGVATDPRGFIQVDEHLATTAPGVSAAGDVTGGLLLAHVAVHQAHVVVDRLAGIDARADSTTVPSVTYTHPEVASVGLTVTQARDAGLDPQVGHFPLTALGRAAAAGQTEGFVQLVTAGRHHRVVGMQAVGPGAGDLIAEGALAIELEATLDDLAATIHAHPTFAEATYEAALVALGIPAHIPAARPTPSRRDGRAVGAAAGQAAPVSDGHAPRPAPAGR